MTEAARRGHEFAGLEHLLYALLFDETTADVLGHAGADVEVLKGELERYLDEEHDRLPDDLDADPRPTLALQRVLARAAGHTESAGLDEVQGYDVLAALWTEPEAYAVQILEAQGVTRLDVVSYLAHGVSKLNPAGGAGVARTDQAAFGTPGRGGAGGALAGVPGGPGMPSGPGGGSGGVPGAGGQAGGGPVEGGAAGGGPGGGEEGAAGDPLSAFTQDLTALAREGHIDPIIGREQELQRTLHILQRRRKNNPVYVGDPGVGKTALAEGLALKIAAGKVPPQLADASIFRLDLGALLAGTRYRGDFENRLKGVLKALEGRPGAILFIDEIHTLIGAGAVSSGTMDASNLLKPALQSGTLRCIGATTWEEYRQYFERDRALARRFQKVEVVEPSIPETVRILHGLQARYEAHHEVRYTRQALRSAAELAARYLRDRRLPDKAIDLIDEAGAAAALAGRRRVGVAEIEAVLATMAQIPPRQVQGDDRERLRGLADALKRTVFGQEAAIGQLVSAIKMARAGLREPEKPVGSFLFTGPTGVGKTEVAKQLAEALGISFLRFDMSEYMERHSVSRLVGAPPGYVGFDRGGLLTEAVSQSPHAVLLLDEIEKAHTDVFNILLQIMDHGTLTDTNGKPADFRHVILLMTSNIGARELAKGGLGFGATTGAGGDEKPFEQLFSPEFRNRLDARISFNALSPEVMGQIVDKFVAALRAQLAPKHVTVHLTDAARDLLAVRGYDPAFGARPLARVIDETVKRPLTDELLFGRLSEGGRVTVDARDGEVVLDYDSAGPVDAR